MALWSIARMLSLPPGKTAAATTCPPLAGRDRSSLEDDWPVSS